MYNEKQIKNLKFTAIRSLVGENGGFAIDGNGVVTFSEGTTPVTEQAIQEEMTRIQSVWDNVQYQRDRAAAYPSIQQQLDMQYWDSVNGTTTWQDAINAVKAQYPKP